MKSKGRNLIEKITNLILNILLVFFGIVLLVSIYTSIQTKILKKEYVDFFGFSIFEVQTGSMSGTIEAGDWIVVKLTDRVELNDVVTYKYKNEYVTHRIIEVYSDKYITRGDANNSDDEPINHDQVIGKVVKTLSNFAVARKIIFNPTVLITLIVTIFLFNIAFKKFNKNTEEDKKLKFLKKMFKKFIELFKRKKKIRINRMNEEYKSKLAKEYLEQYLKENLNQNDNKKYTEEELEKTSLFRVVSVDATDVDKKFVPEESETLEIKKDQKVVEEVKEEADVSLTNVNLELLKNKSTRKNKNVIETTVFIKSEAINEIINVLNEDIKMLPNEKTIKSKFMETYIDAKYNNFYDGKFINSKSSATLMKRIIKDYATYLINKDEKHKDLIVKYANMFFLISIIDQADYDSETIKKEILKYSSKFNSNLDYLFNEFINIKKKYSDMLEYFLKKLETNMFDLIIQKLDSRKDMYGLELKHNISFSKIYSDYIIDKTYTEGIIAEDKMVILFNLLLLQIVKDMISSNFNNKYILYIPGSLYVKEKKFEKILKMLEDKIVKNNVILLVSFEELLNNKEIIKTHRKMGYRFGLVLDREINIKAKERSYIYVADYIFINKNLKNKMSSIIPEDLMNNVIYEDIISKVGDFGSE